MRQSIHQPQFAGPVFMLINFATLVSFVVKLRECIPDNSMLEEMSDSVTLPDGV